MDVLCMYKILALFDESWKKEEERRRKKKKEEERRRKKMTEKYC